MRPGAVVRIVVLGLSTTLGFALTYSSSHPHAALAETRESSAQDQGNALLEGSAVRGKALFERKCTGCHSLDFDREGPHLRGVYGRKAGTAPGFDYSSAMRNSGLTWTNVNLERWLRDSDAMLPESGMGFSVPKPQDRADIIAFLRTQK